MDLASNVERALLDAGYPPEVVDMCLPKMLRILHVEDVALGLGRPLTRKERQHIRLELERGVAVAELVSNLSR